MMRTARLYANICLSKRYCSDKNNKSVATLQAIVSKLKAVAKDPQQKAQKQTSIIHDTRQILKHHTKPREQHKTIRHQQPLSIPQIPEKTSPRQPLLSVPTKLNLGDERDEGHDDEGHEPHEPHKPHKPLEPHEPHKPHEPHAPHALHQPHETRQLHQPPKQEQVHLDDIEHKLQQEIGDIEDIEHIEHKKIRSFEVNQERTINRNKTKYAQIAKDIKEKTMKKDKDSDIKFDITFDDDVSAWIYNEILKYNGERLPLAQDIVIAFPTISIQTAKDIRDTLIDDLIERSEPNTTLRIGDTFSNFNPLETNSDRDPFDFTVHSKSTFDGIQHFDRDFHENGVNVSGLNPSTWFGYNNAAYNSYFNCGEACIDEIESEYGKFRALITKKKNNALSIEMILDLKRKINKINNDSTTISFGITAENRKEYIGSLDTQRILSAYNAGITDIGSSYLSNLFGLIDNMMHLRKPLMIATSGQLSGIQNSLYLTGSARLADSSMRMVLDHALYGQIPCGGFYYLIHNYAYKSKWKSSQILWNILSGEAMSCWSLYDIGIVDWVMPSPNHVLYLNHIGNEIDKTFNYNFKKQDEFRHRAIIKSIIQLFDRGKEHYKANTIHELDYILGSDSNHSIKKVIERIDKLCIGDFEFDVNLNDDMICDIISKANKTKDNINRSSPLALYLSYIMYYGSMKLHEKEQNGTNVFRTLLKYEYNAMCWLMYFGDFWEGIKYQNDNNYVPKWKWSTMEQWLNSRDIGRLLPSATDSLENCIIFNELPLSWMKPLEFDDIDDEWNVNKKHTRVNEEYLSDFLHLGGTVPPNIQLKLMKEYNQYR